MSKFTIIRRLLLKHRNQLILTYILFSLEMFGSLMRPFFLGVAINDLIQGSYHGLFILCLVHVAWLVAGTIRHMYDTRTYSAIYTSLVTKFLSRRFGQTEVSKLSAHSNLAREYVDFLEFDLVFVIEAVCNLFGSLLLLLFYDVSIVVVCLAILLPVLYISYRYGKKMKWLNQMKNDELEKQVDVISSGSKGLICSHFNNLRLWQIKISDKEAWNFGLLEIMVMLVVGISLVITGNTSDNSLMAGTLIGLYNYILKFVSGLDTIPYTVQRLTSLHDITRRIELQDEDFETEKSSIVEPVSWTTLLRSGTY
ncbi:MAG TPA: ABC transporter six-transmembrane domain-containing protein [Chitinophagaceae bacterium]|nr:ABC transporter six-transmembrane domain-containing protein [Chitinophagaceae bacterium]